MLGEGENRAGIFVEMTLSPTHPPPLTFSFHVALKTALEYSTQGNSQQMLKGTWARSDRGHQRGRAKSDMVLPS